MHQQSSGLQSEAFLFSHEVSGLNWWTARESSPLAILARDGATPVGSPLKLVGLAALAAASRWLRARTLLLELKTELVQPVGTVQPLGIFSPALIKSQLWPQNSPTPFLYTPLREHRALLDGQRSTVTHCGSLLATGHPGRSRACAVNVRSVAPEVPRAGAIIDRAFHPSDSVLGRFASLRVMLAGS